jgi:arylsulfatase A-like enzyme
MNKKKNILLIITDQQSSTMMSCAGNTYLKTPAMDSIAEKGVRFDLAFCSNPVCVPSRFSLFTGRYPSEIGQRSNVWDGERLPDAIVNNGLGHKIRDAGYNTIYGGKEHLPKTNAEALGFDYICKDERQELAEVCADRLKQPHKKPFFLVASFINPHDICHMAINEFAEDGLDLILKEKCIREGKTVAEAAQIPEGISEEVFFETYCPPLPCNYELQEDEPEAIKELLKQRKFKIRAREEWGERGWRRHRWAYCKLTEQVDSQIGIILDALRESGLEKDTVVIFTSDHGDHDSSHKLEHKTALYEEATRIPFIICDPDTEVKGSVNSKHLICNGTDLFPTICDYAEAEVPEDLTGLSIKTLAEGKKQKTWREYLLIESEFGHGIRSHNMFYALYDKGANREQLYDLEKDSGQTRSFAKDPTYKKILEKFRNDIKDFPHIKQHLIKKLQEKTKV